MTAGVVGMVLVVVVVIAYRRWGWGAASLRRPCLVAAALFAASLFLPSVAAVEGEAGWIVAGSLAVAVGYLVLVAGILGVKIPAPDAGRAAKGSARPTEPPASRGLRLDRVEDPFDAEVTGPDSDADSDPASAPPGGPSTTPDR